MPKKKRKQVARIEWSDRNAPPLTFTVSTEPITFSSCRICYLVTRPPKNRKPSSRRRRRP